MEEHFKKRGKIFDELFFKYGFKYPFYHSLKRYRQLTHYDFYSLMLSLTVSTQKISYPKYK